MSVETTDGALRRRKEHQVVPFVYAGVAILSPALFAQLGNRVKVTQGKGSAVLAAHADATLAEGTVRIAAGHPATAALGAMFGTVTVEKA